MEHKQAAEHPSKKRKMNRIIDLNLKHSIGAITSLEYKRGIILNQLDNLHYVDGIRSNANSCFRLIGPPTHRSVCLVPDPIYSMEVDPMESKRLLVATKYGHVSIYELSSNEEYFKEITHFPIPMETTNKYGIPNSAHWLWDSTVFTICTIDSLHFWDSQSFEIIESVKMRSSVVNHVIAASKHSTNKFVAVAGITGHVYMIDMRYGIVVMTMNNFEKSPARAIQWHPSNELHYATGNCYGNVCLWDIRFPKKYFVKLSESDSFSNIPSHSQTIMGLRFYNNGNRIISVDKNGTIKTWDVNTGNLRLNHYEPLPLYDIIKSNLHKEYQFDVTTNLKEDIAFLPTSKGLKILDIESGKHLPNSSSTNVPTQCATYDAKRSSVYSSDYNVVTLWSTEHMEKTDDDLQ